MKILYVTTIGATMGFFIPFITCLVNDGHTVDIATNCKDSKVPKVYKKLGCKVYAITTSRNPLDRGNVKAYRRLKHMVYNGSYDIIHCHTPVAGVLTRLAARNARKKGSKVFYTAHGFHFYSGAPVKNWLLYYPIEWICSWLTDILITINKEDYKRAKKHLHAKRIEYVPGVGINMEKFMLFPNGRKKIREELGLSEKRMLLLSVGKPDKSYKAVIGALEDLDVTYVIIGNGKREEGLANTAAEYGVDLRLLDGFCSEVSDFYDAADAYIAPSLQKGIDVSFMEAMASGLPIASCSMCGNTNLIDEPLFNPSDKDEIKMAIEYALKNKRDLGRKNLHKICTVDIGIVQSVVSKSFDTKSYRHLVELIARQEKRSEIGVPWDAKMMLSVGELSARKNHKVVVEALQKLPDNYWYVIAGSGGMGEEIEKLDKTCRLKLLGSRTDVAELLRSSNIFVFPSLQEGLPVALMEAVASGIPVVCSRIRGNVDVIKNDALLFDERDVDDVVEKIKYLMSISDNELKSIAEMDYQSIYKYSSVNINKLMSKLYKWNTRI